MSQTERSRAPGIGALGEVKLSNYGTRAVKVVPDIITPALLHNEVGDPAFRGMGISRSVVKGISRHAFPMGGMILDHTAPFTVEAQIPFVTHDGEVLYWNVVGRNDSVRTPPHSIVENQQRMIRAIAEDPRYAPQQTSEMDAFVRGHNPGLSYGFTRITPDNFELLRPGLQALYAEAFTDYPYDVVGAIGESCGDNLFVAAHGNDGSVFSITGAEYLQMGNGITVAEIGDTASLPNVAGFGPLLKRVLFQTMVERGDVPDLVFTDSRLDESGSVIKANRRAGLRLNPGIILPSHTTIASNRTQGAELMQRAPDGREFPVENMTMTHLTREGIQEVIAHYGNTA